MHRESFFSTRAVWCYSGARGGEGETTSMRIESASSGTSRARSRLTDDASRKILHRVVRFPRARLRMRRTNRYRSHASVTPAASNTSFKGA